MAQYETALKKEENLQNQAALHLKIARLYFMVRDYSWAIGHYEKAMELERDLFLVDDVCDYIDALRFQGQTRKAEAICLDNAYKDQYSRYQRYQNTLEALAMRHSVQEFPGFTAKRLALNTPNAEFWIGNYGEQPFYALLRVEGGRGESDVTEITEIFRLFPEDSGGFAEWTGDVFTGYAVDGDHGDRVR